MRRYPIERLHDPGSDMALSSAPLPPPALDGGDDDDAGWVARGLTSSGDGSLVSALVGGVVVSVGGRGRGVLRRLVGFLAGVRRTKIKAGRYKVGWMKLSACGRKRGAAVLVAGTRTGSQGWGASSGVVGNGDGRGPDDRASDAPPCHVSESVGLPHAPR